jgi:hypothetical protein
VVKVFLVVTVVQIVNGIISNIMLRTEAIKQFLLNVTHRDLANLYNIHMEVQVNVAQNGGERIEGEYKGKRWQGWSDGKETWKSFRIPYNAAVNPQYEDKDINFNLGLHAEAIGMTGWDWYNKQSLWVAFDFDAITSHASGLTTEQLILIQEQALEVPYLTVRKSTSGNGLHLYIFFGHPPETINHNEHQALARAVLSQLSAETGFNFINTVDICGGNMWVWHRKMSDTNKGLILIKQGELLYDVPVNWKDHVDIVVNKRRKNLPQQIGEQSKDVNNLFLELTGQYVRESLDDIHLALINYLKETSACWWWDQDNNMLVTHTIHLKEAHVSLNFKGIFETISTGTDKGSDHNCFAFPLRRGAWVVRRFTPGCREHESWEQDGNNWTFCYYNMDPNLSVASKTHEGVEHPSGGYVFNESENAQKAALLLGADLNLPPMLLSRPTKLKQNKDGRLIVEINKENTDNPGKMKGWIAEGTKWKRIFNIFLSGPASGANEQKNYDDLIRHLTTEDKTDCGWVLRSNSIWIEEPMTHIKLALKSHGLKISEIDNILGTNIFKHWKIVNMPFQPEYPGDRQWNREACQFNYLPSKADNLHYPTWKKILTHVGKNLTPALKESDWAKSNGILTGYDYVKCWIASVFQQPHEPLPYLFFFGPEASGKSIFHEALSLLITPNGYERAEQALLSSNGFNGELKSAIFCVIEETNLSTKNKTAYTRIKDWVTSPYLSIHPKGGTPYLIKNTSHWIQCGNELSYCPAFPGDTRIVIIYVEPPDVLQTKNELFARLCKEASDFLGEVLKLELPKSNDRLNLPVISTSQKILLQQQNQSALEEFINENCFHSPGYMIKLSEFYERFCGWLDITEASNWTIRRVAKSILLPYVKGRSVQDNYVNIGNLSFEQIPKENFLRPLIVLDGKLYHDHEH